MLSTNNHIKYSGAYRSARGTAEMSVPGDGWVVGLGSSLCAESLGGQAQLLGRGFILQAAAQSCTGGRALSRALLLEGSQQGSQLLLASRILMNAKCTHSIWHRAGCAAGVPSGVGASAHLGLQRSLLSKMLCAGCQHHIFLCQSPGLGPSLHLATHRDHVWPLVTFSPS